MNTPEELIPVIDWWQKDGKKTVALLACVGVVALCVNLWFARSNRLEGEASNYAYGPDASIEELQDAVAKYSSQKASGVIKLRLAEKYAQEKQYENAVEIYKALAADNSIPEVLASRVALGLANCQESLAQWGDALKTYEALSAGDNAAIAFDVKLGVARCYAFTEGAKDKLEKLEALKKEYANDKFLLNRIEKTIDVIKSK